MIRPDQTVFVDPMELDPCSLKVLLHSLRDSPPSNFPIRRGNTTLDLNIQSQRAPTTSPRLPLLLQCYRFGVFLSGIMRETPNGYYAKNGLCSPAHCNIAIRPRDIFVTLNYNSPTLIRAIRLQRAQKDTLGRRRSSLVIYEPSVAVTPATSVNTTAELEAAAKAVGTL
ncbi:hypothetical protein BDP55DRAFT_626578 [Colletotrichum godetiae]|uniref:Uncharacterized protein n=1 Tax=Colletotrichum godetiae TaxID=1209918 RepID=A0AAJ0EZB4_9PEZI|nr:uncharacterized protein BDP55DRAFT_626578 [Colletotrichum godetiae]KAK1699898.1 hypothetical protein BDP55DRAFT_626578 [Colletotrichum godetiae]